jgi:hypothetical protein
MAAEHPAHDTHAKPHHPAPANPPKPPAPTGQPMQEALKTWVMVILTFLFVAVYFGVLLGWISKPANQPDPQTLSRIEAILFVIIGYYFGRLPVAATEKTLKDEIHRQTGKADNAEEEKTNALQENQRLHEKVKNTKAALSVSVPEAAPEDLSVNLSRGGSASPPADALRHSVLAAVRVLDS